MWTILMGTAHDASTGRPVPYSCAGAFRTGAPPAGWGRSARTVVRPRHPAGPCAGGPVHLGKVRDHLLYGWDDEYRPPRGDCRLVQGRDAAGEPCQVRALMDDGSSTDKRGGRVKAGPGASFVRQPTRCSGCGVMRRLNPALPGQRRSRCRSNWPVEVNRSRRRPSATGRRQGTAVPSACPPKPNGTGTAGSGQGLPDQPDRSAPPPAISSWRAGRRRRRWTPTPARRRQRRAGQRLAVDRIANQRISRLRRAPAL